MSDENLMTLADRYAEEAWDAAAAEKGIDMVDVRNARAALEAALSAHLESLKVERDAVREVIAQMDEFDDIAMGTLATELRTAMGDMP